MSSPPDRRIVAAALANEPGAMDALCEHYLPIVLGWAKRLGGPRVQAGDVAHDAWIIVMRKIHTVRDEAAFGAWLYGITRRVVAGHRRRAWFRKWVGAGLPEQEDPAEGPGEHAQRSQEARQILKALDLLSADHREIVVLCDIEERADSEVSDLLDVPKGTVKSRLRRARKELRRHLEALSP